MSNTLKLLLFIPLFTACHVADWQVDREKRIELFNSCMSRLPAGPVATQYNDWDEVVSECDNVAYRQATYDANKVKK